MVNIIVDATSEISPEMAKELGIVSIPMKVSFANEEFLSGVNLSNEEFFERLISSKELPHTSQLNCEDWVNAIKPFIDKGEEVLAMSLSSGLSGTFNSLRLAEEEINSNKLKIIDTETVTFAFAALVLEAVKLAKTGVGLEELSKQMEELKGKVKLLAIIDNVKFLVKGGRLSMAKGLIASFLKLKPLVSMVNKKLQMIGKAIGYENAKKHLCKLIKDVDNSKPIYFGHSNAPQRGEELKQMVSQQFGFKFERGFGIGPVIGTHAGPGCSAIVYFEK